VWRLFYLRDKERELDERAVDCLTATSLRHADRVSRVLGSMLVVAAVGTLTVPYLAYLPPVRYVVLVGTLGLGILMIVGVKSKPVAAVSLIVAIVLVGTWSLSDAGTDWHGLIRLAHLSAFSLWLGGALWNISVAMPAGREHPDVIAVLAGARQLDRFRWVVRFSLPTIIVTGLVMAGVYTVLPIEWWMTFPGILIPLKVLAIIALVVVFITCPLFRQCSPVQGICNIDDLADMGSDRETIVNAEAETESEAAK
jgi:putative copper resistance protein D